MEKKEEERKKEAVATRKKEGRKEKGTGPRWRPISDDPQDFRCPGWSAPYTIPIQLISTAGEAR